MKVLIIAGYLEANIKDETYKTRSIKGGASKSITNIVNSLRNTKNIQIKTLTQKFRNKLLKSLDLDSYILIPRIIRNILKFKPDIIITQDRIAFPTILISRIKKIPVIHIIRSPVAYCPKYVDITDYGKSCSGINNRKQCFKCIDKWRSLRILVGNRPEGTEYSLKTSLLNVFYKIRYFVCLFNLYLINKASINLVASKIMKEFFSYKVNKNKLKIMNITPIRKYKNDTISKKKQLMFIRTHYDASHKGIDFILRLSKIIPEDYHILTVGGCKEDWKGDDSKIINLEFISSKKLLNKMFGESMITLVPSFFLEAFGRIIPESLTNKTPVISSPQCGANQFFDHKNYLKVVPLKLKLWIKEIEGIIQKPPAITDDDISQIYDQFSLEKSKNDFMEIIEEVLNNNKL